MNDVATTLALHEPNRTFMGDGEEVYSIFFTYKYAVDSYQDGEAQHLCRGLLVK